MGNVLHVTFHYFIDTQAGVVCVECLLLHKRDKTKFCLLLLHRSVPQHGYFVPCGVYRDTPMYGSGPTIDHTGIMCKDILCSMAECFPSK